MKSTDLFKNTIQQHLQQRAAADPLFTKTFAKENKSIDGCINYILVTVQKSGCNGFADDEIYSMAVHYYDEDSIKDVAPVKANVVVNHHVEKAKESKDDAKPVKVKPAKVEKKQLYVQQGLFD